MCLVNFTANLSVNMLSEIDHKAITSNPETKASSKAHLTLDCTGALVTPLVIIGDTSCLAHKRTIMIQGNLLHMWNRVT